MRDALPPVPVPDGEDRAQALFRAVLGSLPLPGTAALVEAFNLFFSPEIERRTRAWLEELRSAVVELQNRLDADSFERLRDDPAFYSAVAQATEVARRTHQKEKLAMLRNAVVHAALPWAPEEDVRSIFFTLIGDFTPTHILLLKTLDHFPRVEHSGPVMGRMPTSEVLAAARPEWAGKGDLLFQMANRMVSDGLVMSGVTNANVSTVWLNMGRVPESFTTDLGKQFLRFIEEPRA